MTPTPGSWLSKLIGTPEAPTVAIPQEPIAPVVIIKRLSVPAAAVEIVAAFEGLRQMPYPDPGSGGLPITCGYGSTRDANGKPFVLGGPPLSQVACRALLERDLGEAAAAVARNVTVALSEPCRAALCSWIYNLGEGNFKKSGLLRLINAGELRQAADQFPLWNRAAGHVMNGLVVRRAAERKLFLSGVPA